MDDNVKSKLNIFEKHIKISIEKFGNKFDYSKFIYTRMKSRGIIICPLHGEFTQCIDKHSSSVHGCMKCSRIDKKTVLTIKKKIKQYQYFLEKAIGKYGNTYTYDADSYKGLEKNINITCKKHGVFTAQANIFLLGTIGCSLCSNEKRIKTKTKSYEFVIEQLLQKHNNKYIYPIENK